MKIKGEKNRKKHKITDLFLSNCEWGILVLGKSQELTGMCCRVQWGIKLQYEQI